MRNLFTPCLLAASLAACATLPPGTNVLDQVRAFTLIGCSFVPLAETIAEIIATNSPGLRKAQQIADAICAAEILATQATAQRALVQYVPTVAGVTIYGSFAK